MLVVVAIIASLVQAVCAQTTYQSNPYLQSFRSGLLLFLSGQAYRSSDRTSSATYASALTNSTNLQCFAFMTYFQYASFHSTLYAGVTSVSCNQTAVSISIAATVITQDLITYLVICNDLVGSPNFIVTEVSGTNGPAAPTPTTQNLSNLNTTGTVKFYNLFSEVQSNICIDNVTNSSSDYGYKIEINSYNSTSFTFTTLFIGNTTRIGSCTFANSIRFVVIIVNQNYFSNQKTIIMSGASRTFTNLTSTTFQNQMNSSLGLNTLAGLIGFKYNRKSDGLSSISFYFGQKTNGEITVNSTIADNLFYLNYLTIPNQVPIFSAVTPQNSTDPPQNSTNSTQNSTNSTQNSTNSTQNNTSPAKNSTIPNQNNNMPIIEEQGSNSKNIIIGVSASVGTLILLSVVIYWCKHHQAKPIAEEVIGSSTSNQIHKEQINCSSCNGIGVQITTSCLHSFHFNCLKQNLKLSQNCPVCYRQLTNSQFSVTCSKCKRVTKLRLPELMLLDISIQLQINCPQCLQNDNAGADDPRLATSQIIWMEYGMGLNERIIVIQF